MAFILEPELDAIDLCGRLGQLRARLRRGIVATGVFHLFAGIIIAVALLTGLDHWLSVPEGLRAMAVFALVIVVSILFDRWIVKPWRQAGDELYLARCVQARVPALADTLASAVQFEDSADGSECLRKATRHYAIQRSRSVDFSHLTDANPMLQSVLISAIAVGLSVQLAAFMEYPGTAIQRSIDPFGGHAWPTHTRISVAAPPTIARGEAFELTATITGVVPDRMVLELVVPPLAGSEHVYALAGEEGGAIARVTLEPSRVPRSFQYRLTAGDATTDWRTTNVIVPPQLAVLDDRPSPQMQLTFPPYTDQHPQILPDGAGALSAVFGTTVHLRAAVDRPIAKATVAFRPSDPRSASGLVAAGLASANATSLLGLLPATTMLFDTVRLHVAGDGQLIHGSFTPLLSGHYEVRPTDANGLAGRFPIDIRVLHDSSPRVALEQPSADYDGIELMPEAAFDLRAAVDDPTFAIRSVVVEYRTAVGEPARKIVLYDGVAIGAALPKLLTAMPVSPAKLRAKQLLIDRRMPISHFVHANGRPLTSGDAVTFCIAADDFDDVSPDKSPGRSTPMTIHVVGRHRLDERLIKMQAELARGLRKLHQMQTEALALAAPAERTRRGAGVIGPAERDAIAKAEQTQQQIQSRLGDERNGLIAAADAINRAMTDNPESLPGVRDRARQLERELQRLAGSVLAPVPQMLSAGKGEQGQVPINERNFGPLAEAVARQREAEQSLRELADEADAGSEVAALTADASAMASQQEQLSREREKLDATIPAGTATERLKLSDRDQLSKLKEKQDALAKRAAEFVAKLDQRTEAIRQLAEREAERAEQLNREAGVTDGSRDSNAVRTSAARAFEKSEQLRDEAATLERARAAAGPSNADPLSGALPDQLTRAAEAIAKNRLGEAKERQENAGRQLDRVKDALQTPPKSSADRLSKALQQAEAALEKLTSDQESLQDRTNDANEEIDHAKRTGQMEALAKEQEKLTERAQDLARDLSRHGEDQSSRELNRGARSMEQSSEQLRRGRSSTDQQEDALNRMDSAADRIAQSRREVEERLEREKLAKLADRLKGIADRQASLSAEAERLFRAARANAGWSRSLQKSIADLANDERGLAQELERVIAQAMDRYAVIRRLSSRAAGAMMESASAIDDAKAEGLSVNSWEADREAVREPQALAGTRLQQVLEVLKARQDEPHNAQSAARTPSNSKPGGDQSAPDPNAVPPTAELKLLRTMQAELKEQVARFRVEKPDSSTWTASDKAKMARFRAAQAELVELFSEITSGGAATGGGQ